MKALSKHPLSSFLGCGTISYLKKNQNFIEQPLVCEEGLFYIPSSYKIDSQDLQDTCHEQEIQQAKLYTSSLKSQEFLYSRYLIRLKLGLNKKSKPLSKKDNGAFLWPFPYNGSLSHKAGHVLCLITQSKSFVGVDLEEIRVSSKVVERICFKKDLSLWKKLSTAVEKDKQKYINTLFFSMKEAAFKAFSNHYSKNIDLHLKDIILETLDFQEGHFSLYIFYQNKKLRLSGRFFWLFTQENNIEPKFVLCYIKQ